MVPNFHPTCFLLISSSPSKDHPTLNAAGTFARPAWAARSSRFDAKHFVDASRPPRSCHAEFFRRRKMERIQMAGIYPHFLPWKIHLQVVCISIEPSYAQKNASFQDASSFFFSSPFGRDFLRSPNSPPGDLAGWIKGRPQTSQRQIYEDLSDLVAGGKDIRKSWL